MFSVQPTFLLLWVTQLIIIIWANVATCETSVLFTHELPSAFFKSETTISITTIIIKYVRSSVKKVDLFRSQAGQQDKRVTEDQQQSTNQEQASKQVTQA